jgi:hypothetical protein
MTGMTADSTRPENLGKVDELWRYEEERSLRRQRFNRFSLRIVALVMIGALGLLSYDAGQAAWTLRQNKPLAVPHNSKLAYAADIHGSWVYPAIISGVSGLAALVILYLALRGRRRGAHRTA